jgi:hypothetical protein
MIFKHVINRHYPFERFEQPETDPSNAEEAVMGPGGSIEVSNICKQTHINFFFKKNIKNNFAEHSCQSRASCDECVVEAFCVWCPGLHTCADGELFFDRFR